MENEKIEILPSDWRPDVQVPDEIWRRVRSWEGDHLCPFDVRLRNGQVLDEMCIDKDGGMHGQMFADGINMSTVYFAADDIAAIRPRTGSILKEAGLTPCQRRGQHLKCQRRGQPLK